MNKYSIDKKFSLQNIDNVIYSIFEIFLKELLEEDIFDSIGSNRINGLYLSFRNKIGFIVICEKNDKIKFIEEDNQLLLRFKFKLRAIDQEIRYFDEDQVLDLLQSIFSLVKFLIIENSSEYIIYITNRLYLKKIEKNIFRVRFIIEGCEIVD